MGIHNLQILYILSLKFLFHCIHMFNLFSNSGRAMQRLWNCNMSQLKQFQLWNCLFTFTVCEKIKKKNMEIKVKYSGLETGH